jgi:tetratricopeptide (TPR) repeat protein
VRILCHALLVEAHPVNEIFEILEIMDQMKSENKFDQTIVRVLLSMIQGNYEETAQYIQSIHDNPPNEDEFLMSLLDMAQAIIFEEDVDTTLARLLDTSKKAKAKGNLTIAITSLCFAGDLVRSQGKLHGSWKIYQDALALAKVNDEEYLPAGSIALLDLGEVSYKWNKLDDAEKYLKKSLELSDNWEIMHFFSGLTSWPVWKSH